MVVVHSQDLTKSARTHADSETLVSAPRTSRESMVQMVDGQIAQIILSHLPILTDCFLLSFSWAITIWRIVWPRSWVCPAFFSNDSASVAC